MHIPLRVRVLLAAALGAAGTIAAKAACPQARRFKPYAGGKGHCLLDKRSKFIVCGSPKAAATTAFMIALHVANETAAAHEWLVSRGLRDVNTTSTSAVVHRYRIDAFQQADAHSVRGGIAARAAKLCTTSGWLCVVLVRNPLDRAISSFLHIAKTGLGVVWPELVAVVRDVSLVRAGNFTFRQHVRALELFAARNRREGMSAHSGKWAADHVLPQSPRWLHSMIRSRSDAAGISDAAKLAGAVKLVPVDSISKSLAAVDAHFRHDRELGLEAATTGLHSSHWVSAGPDPAANIARGASALNATAAEVASIPLGRSLRRRTDDGADPSVLDDGHSIDTDTFASVLCGLGTRGGFGLSNNGRRHADCVLAKNTYARMQATDPSVWARVRCLFYHDVQLYYKQVCTQGWLRRRCPTCLERSCGDARAA